MHLFQNIILNGRPAGGKSELIDFLKKLDPTVRAQDFHIGMMEEIDDFVWLWDKFVEDDLWEALGEPRRFSKKIPHGYIQLEGDRLLDMLILKFNHTIQRDFEKGGFYKNHTLFIEFARGTQDGGLKHAYELFSPEILKRSAIVYISVSYEESKRRNEARYREALAHSILAHKLPDESLERFSRFQDWNKITEGKPFGYLEIQGIRVPFVTVENEPELKDHQALAQRYEPAFQALWKLYRAQRD